MAADGYIIIESGIKADGFIKGSKDLEAACRRSAARVSDMGSKAALSVTKAVHAIEQQNAAYRRQEARVEELRRKIREVNETPVETEAFKAVQRELDQLSQKLAAADERKRQLFEAGKSEDSPEFRRAEEKAASLSAEFDAALAKKNALLESGGAYTTGDTSVLTSKLTAAEERLAAMGNRLDDTYAGLKQRTESLAASQTTLKDRITGAAGGMANGLKKVLMYGVGLRTLYMVVQKARQYITEGIKAYAAYDTRTSASINNLKSALNGLKGSLATAFAPIFNAVAPALQTLINWLASAASAVSVFFAVLGGQTTYKRAVVGLNQTASAASGVGKAAEEARRQLAGLDEMNRWEDKSSAGGGGGGGGADGGISFVEESINPDAPVAKIAEYVRANLESVLLLVEEFAFVIGMVLTFSGANIPLGLGMMIAAGIAGYSNIKENWGAIKEQLQGSMGSIYTIVGGASLVIGTILAFSGASLPVGLALMVSGAAALVTVAVANWGTLKENIGGTTQAILTLVSGALVVLGAVLAFSGVSIPLGIALIAAGAATLAASATLNWGAIQDKLQGPVGKVVAIASGALLALGLILAFSGVGLPLGIGLIAAGAAGLAATVTANWNTIKEKLQPALDVLYGIGSAALLVLGLVLAFSGVGLPLGIALIKAGAKGLAQASASPVWTIIGDKIQGALASVKEAWEAWKEKHPVIAGILDTIFGVAAAAASTAKDLVVTFAGKADASWTSMTKKWDDIKNSEAVKTIKGTVTQAWTNVKSAWAAVKSEPSIKTIGGALKTTGTEAWNVMKTAWNSVKSVSAFKTISGKITPTWNSVKRSWESVKSLGVFKTISGRATQTWSSIKAAWEAVKNSNVTKTIMGATNRAWATVKSAWEGLKSEGITKTIMGIAEQSFWNIKNWWDSITNKKVTITASGHSDLSGKFASGGVITRNSIQHWGIPMYAGGTTSAHGSMFIAGEAGPEIIGHINGRTEILNKSQLAEVMYGAMVSGIGPRLAAIRASIEAINSKLPRFSVPLPVVATGTVIPPQALQAAAEADAMRNALSAAANRGGMGTGAMPGQGRNVYKVQADVRGYNLFRILIDEGKNEMDRTGSNPFMLGVT